MKPPPLILHIPDPCHENWDTMQPTVCGRHCAACEKTVVDFTGFSDELLLNYFKRNGDNEICGRMLVSQTNRPIVKARSRIGWGWYAKIAATLLTIQASAVTAFAQKAKRPPTTINARPEVLPDVVVHGFRQPLIDPKVPGPVRANGTYSTGMVVNNNVNAVASLDTSVYTGHGGA